jgi:hypothetical protein
MINDSIHESTMPKPDSVLLGEIAIAAGLAGRPVAVCFTESSATLDAELWQNFAQFAGSGRVWHIYSQADVRQLRKAFSSQRLVVVHEPRLFERVAWVVKTQQSTTSARPALFSRSVPDSADEIPLPVTVVRSSTDESSALSRWLMSGSTEGISLPAGLPQNSITLHPDLLDLTMPNHSPTLQDRGNLRDCQLLAALLFGASLLKNIEQSHDSSDLQVCGPHEYEIVRRLLQSPILSYATESVDPPAIDMVNRANVFLELKQEPEFVHTHPSLSNFGDPIHRQRGSRTGHELVTRREIADLGNTRSRLVRELVSYFRQSPEGYQRYVRMGLIRKPPSDSQFPDVRLPSLTSALRSWSPKQVRTQFDSLQKSGLISGERKAGNGPWEYRLPEELQLSSSPFLTLPSVGEVFSGTCSTS